MRRVLILNEFQDPTYQSLSTQFSSLEDVSIGVANDVQNLEFQIHTHPIQLLILIVEESPSESFLQKISKCKNMSGIRDAQLISIHKKHSNAGIQKALMAGVKFIFLEPIDKGRILQTAKSLLDGNTLLPAAGTELYKINRAPCRIEVFGRIGKIYTFPAGDLHVEVDAQLEQSQYVEVQTLLGRDLGLSTLKYSVASTAAEDTYYHYRHSYHLSLLGGSELRKKFSKWMTANKKNFSLPKTKVLWIRENSLGALESALNKKIFSLYVQSPGKVTQSYLSKLNPRIIIADQLPEVSLHSVESWTEMKGRANVLLISTGVAPSSLWQELSFESRQDPPIEKIEPLAEKFNQLAKPYLSERITHSIYQFKFLDRKSNYSRFSLSLDAHLDAVGYSHLSLETHTDLEPGTVFYLDCPPFQGWNRFGVYLKTLKSEPLTRSYGFRLLCEILPASDEPHLVIAGLLSSVLANLDQSQPHFTNSTPTLSESTSQTAQTASRLPLNSSPELFFLEAGHSHSNVQRKQRLGKFLFAVLLFGVLFLILSYGMRPRQAPEKTPASLQDALRGIRDAFQ